MTVTKRKKNSRQRGTHTHGCGSKKKRRGAGNRGGKGNAGTGKRGDAKKPSIWKNKKYFGKYGFKKLSPSEDIRPVNLSYFEEKLNSLLSEKLIEKQEDAYVIDAEKLGFNKILGSKKITTKFNISSPLFSKKAAERIEEAGGKAIESKKTKSLTKPENKPVKEKAGKKTDKDAGSEKPAAKKTETKEETDKKTKDKEAKTEEKKPAEETKQEEK